VGYWPGEDITWILTCLSAPAAAAAYSVSSIPAKGGPLNRRSSLIHFFFVDHLVNKEEKVPYMFSGHRLISAQPEKTTIF
jgi:hypothetical protein